MKKISILAMCFVVSTIAFSQSNAIKVNFLSPIIKVGNFQFEHVLNEKSSIQLGVFFGKIKVGDSDVSFTGLGITPEYRFYLGEDPAPSGFFVAPFVRYRSFTIKDDEFGDEGTISLFGGGLLVGRQWLFSEKVTFELFLGPQFSGGSAKVTSGQGGSIEDDSDIFEGFGLRAGVSLGFAF